MFQPAFPQRWLARHAPSAFLHQSRRAEEAVTASAPVTATLHFGDLILGRRSSRRFHRFDQIARRVVGRCGISDGLRSCCALLVDLLRSMRLPAVKGLWPLLMTRRIDIPTTNSGRDIVGRVPPLRLPADEVFRRCRKYATLRRPRPRPSFGAASCRRLTSSTWTRFPSSIGKMLSSPGFAHLDRAASPGRPHRRAVGFGCPCRQRLSPLVA